MGSAEVSKTEAQERPDGEERGEERCELFQAGPGLGILLGIKTQRHQHLKGQSLSLCQRGLTGSTSVTASSAPRSSKPSEAG